MRMSEMIERAYAGPVLDKRRHVARAETILALVRDRFGIRHDQQLRCAHLRWVLNRKLADKRPSTTYGYWLTVRLICRLLDRDHWLPHLRGAWQWPDGVVHKGVHPGGRPPRLPPRTKRK